MIKTTGFHSVCVGGRGRRGLWNPSTIHDGGFSIDRFRSFRSGVAFGSRRDYLDLNIGGGFKYSTNSYRRSSK